MELQETQIVVQFAGGVETKQDRKGVLPGKLLALENSVFTKAISLVKRNGYADLGNVVMGSSSTLPTGKALGVRGTELVHFSEDLVHSYVPSRSAWVQAGEMRSVSLTHRPVAKTGSNQTIGACAVNSGVALNAWEDSRGGVYYSLEEDATRRSIVAETQADALGSRPRCIAVGNFLHLYYARVGARELVCLRFEVATPKATPTQTILTIDLDGAVPVYDVDQAVYNGIPAAFAAWARADDTVQVTYIHESGELGSAANGLPVPVTFGDSDVRALGVAFDATAAVGVVAWARAASVRYRSFSTALSTLHGVRILVSDIATPTQVTVAFDGRTETEGPTIEVFFELSAAAAQDYQVHRYRANADAATFTTYSSAVVRGVGLGSKAFKYGTDAYVHLMRDSTLYRTYFTMRARGQLVVSRFLPSIAGGLVLKNHLPSVWTSPTDSSVKYFAAIYVTDVESANGDVFAEKGLRRVDIDFDEPTAFRSAQLGQTLYISGGMLHSYDGTRIVEAGFHYAIDDLSAPTIGAPTGAGISIGTREYVFVLEDILANGEVVRGPISPPVLVETTNAAGRRVTFTIPTCRLTARTNARIGVYRSEDGDPSIKYRVSNLDPTTVGAVNGYVANSTTVDSVTFIDEMTDDDLIEQEPLYSTGGIVENDPLGGVGFLAVVHNRLMMVDPADPLAIYFSQELAEGYAVEMSPALRIPVDPYGGSITGVAGMDGATIISKRTALFGMSGTGPAANPDFGGGFSEPALIPGDVGSVSADTLEYTPIGVVFQSLKGLQLLGRDGSVKYIGAPVEAYNSQTFVSADLIEDKTQIRFLTSSGITLLYDYERDQWSEFTNHAGQDAVVVDGLYYYLRNDGQVWKETPGVYRDNNSQIRRAEETSWLKLAGHSQGWQRLWFLQILGEWASTHSLKVSIAYDYEEGWYGVPIVIDASEGRNEALYGAGLYGAGVYGGTPDTRYQWEIHIGQECEAVRFRFEDVEPTGSFGASYELSELLLVGGVESGKYSLEEARRN